MGTIIVVAIVLSYSRAGIISLAAVCTIFLYQKLLHRRILKFSLLAGFSRFNLRLLLDKKGTQPTVDCLFGNLA